MHMRPMSMQNKVLFVHLQSSVDCLPCHAFCNVAQRPLQVVCFHFYTVGRVGKIPAKKARKKCEKIGGTMVYDKTYA